MNNLKHTEEVLRKFPKGVIKSARQNLTKQGKNVNKDLYKSLDYKLVSSPNSFELAFLMNTYGLFQDRGVDGTQKKYKLVGKVAGLKKEYSKKFSYKNSSNLLGLEANTGVFAKWLKAERIRLRDSKGRFISYKQGGFAVAMNKKRIGIAPSLFFTKPFARLFPRLSEDILKAYELDLDNFLQFSLSNILKDDTNVS